MHLVFYRVLELAVWLAVRVCVAVRLRMRLYYICVCMLGHPFLL